MNINRSFVYGDLFFETIKVVNNHIQLLEYHYKRVNQTARFLGFEMPPNWNIMMFEEQIKNALIDNHHRVRFLVYRNATGFYCPQNNTVKISVEVFPLPNTKSCLNKIDVYERDFKACSPLSNHKTGNALLYVLASMYAESMSFDDVLILNQYQRIAEATSSNIFIIKNSKIYTPPLTEGCIMGVYRQYLLATLPKEGYTIVEQPITLPDFIDADECFFTNSLQGIVEVKSYRHKKFNNQIIQQIQPLIS